MGNLLSNTSTEGRSSQQSGADNIFNSDNTNSGAHNILNSGNTNTINQGDANPTRNHAEILQCLHTSQYESHRNRVREPVEGTCTWVMEHQKYKDWWEKETSGLLWLSADPGCGKSVTASFLITHPKNKQNAIVCYFFFKDDNEEQRSATFALCAILHQLFLQERSLCLYAEEAFKCKKKGFVEKVDTLWDILVKAVAEGGCGDVICVVDALDECEEGSLDQLIHHITCLSGPQTSHIPLKFLVTSRPYRKIERVLGSPETTIRLKGEDEVNALTTDVTRVIDEGIKKLESYWGRPGGLGYLRNLLESSADRTFLWVSLVLGVLNDSEDDSTEEFTKIATTAPRDLAELYTKILDKSTKPDKARRILNIVVAAARPLTLREMNVAFKIKREHNSIKDLGDLSEGFEKVKNLCGLFVRVIDSKIYLAHPTAREFLIKGSSSGHGNWQYTLCPGDSNFIMTDICISYLSLEEFESDPLVLSFDNYLQKYAFLDYAARHWTDHFRDLKDQQMELFEFTRLICEAGSGRFLTWLQVYWFHVEHSYECPKYCTHLMIASWLGQGTVVARLLGDGGDIHTRDEIYGTALNLAAIREDEDITRMLLQRNIQAYFYGKGYNILHVKRPLGGSEC
ncbi:NACHT-ANK domain protein transcript variant 3 [Choiromyces venosus 120613-1]|uniref:NACHT-ANK domain protein transcript variant 3 n=1 Tax=Choiromyces venosus 120613-1 TaxID=1336337 RepID=A0A3N4J5T3_9PEZI|nr:NACHT-ANK domain protein transcript variant 3 [Choiromyces venosus 120613-1]